MTISVTVELFGPLRQRVGQRQLQLVLADRATVLDAMLACELEDRVDIWALCDGRRVSRQALLTDGSRVSFFMPVGGG